MAVPLIPAEPYHPDREKLRQLGERVRRRLAAHKSAQVLLSDPVELWAVGGFYSPEECARLMELIDRFAQPSRTYRGEIDQHLRTSYSAVLDGHDPVVRKLQRRIDTLLGFDRLQGEMLQGQRYTQGQEFKPHTDWFPQLSPAWASERNNGGQRAITAMVFLNSVHDGGETDFPHLDLAIPPRQGVLLVWNNADREGVPNPFTMHAGNPLRSGTKYVVTRWYRCGKTLQPG